MNDGAEFAKAVVWNGVDIMVSAGLLAGGADVFHKVAEVIVGGLNRLEGTVKGEQGKARSPHVDIPTYQSILAGKASEGKLAAKSYSISVSRPTGATVDEGTLVFTGSGVTIQARCWWDPNNRIDAGTYTKCSKTHMTKSNLEAIYLPDAVSKVTGAKEIFIHPGSSSLNSLGCIAVETELFGKIWKEIEPLNGFNVTVTVADT